MGIMSLVLLGVYTLLHFALRWHAKMDDTVDVYQDVLKASQKLSTDLGTGSVVSFIYEQGVGLTFASARPDSGPFQLDPSGNLLWQKQIIYYIEDDKLYRNEVPISPPSTVPPTATDLNSVKSLMSGQGQIVANKVSDLEVIPDSGASIRFTVEGDRPDSPNAITLQSRMTFRQ